METVFKIFGKFKVFNEFRQTESKVNVVQCSFNQYTHPDFFTKKGDIKKSKVVEVQNFINELKLLIENGEWENIKKTGCLLNPLHQSSCGFSMMTGDEILEATGA
jgi:hypothetical protein